MDRKMKKPAYEPPVVRDLSGMSALGDISPMSQCIDGSSLTSEFCSFGDGVLGGDCNPTGLSAANCIGGGLVNTLPSQGYCDSGNGASEQCLSGSIHK